MAESMGRAPEERDGRTRASMTLGARAGAEQTRIVLVFSGTSGPRTITGVVIGALLVFAVSHVAPLQARVGQAGVVPAAEKLDARLLQLLHTAGLDEFVHVDLVLTEQCPDEAVRAAANLRTKRERRELVVALLKDAALPSQEPLVRLLEGWRAEGHVRGRIDRLWIHNVVAAEVKLAAVTELAARADVALVHYDPPRGEEV